MVCLRLLQIVLLVLVESYLYLLIYYQHFLKVVLHHKRKPLEGGCFPLWDSYSYVIFFYSFDTFMVSKRLTNYFYCFFVVFNFLFFCNVCWFSSARAFYDIYVVVNENSHKFFFFSNFFYFSVNIISVFSRNPLFVRNGLKPFVCDIRVFKTFWLIS